jgi:O-antigen ligase
MSTKEKILYSLILLFFVTFYMPSWTQTANGVVIGLMVLYSFFFSSWKERWQLFKERKYIVSMIVFFGLVLISLFTSENLDRGFRNLDTRLALLYLPLSIGLINIRKEFRDKVLLGFAVITTLVGMVCVAWSIHRTITFDRLDYLYNDSLTLLIERQSIYVSLLVTLSIFFFAYHLFYVAMPSGQKTLIGFATIFLFAFSYLLASRNLMIVLYGTTLIFAFYYILKNKKYLEGVTLVMGLLIGVFLTFKFFPQTLNRFKELTYTNFDYQSRGKESHFNVEVTKDQWNGANFRLAAWSCGLELFKRNPVFGVGLGDKRDELYKMYEEKQFYFARKEGKNVHSNYIDILYSMGIIGFAAFLLAWVVLPLLRAWSFRDGLAFLVIGTFAIAMITEIYFDRTIGGLTAAFFIPFLLADKKRRQP